MDNKSEIKYTGDNNLDLIMLSLVVAFPILFWGLMILSGKTKDLMLELSSAFIIMWGNIVLAFIFTHRSKKKFIKNRDEIMSTGKKANGRIVSVIKEYSRPVRGNENTNVSMYTSLEVEYYNQYMNCDTVVLVEGLHGMPYGKDKYIEENIEQGYTYTPKENLRCTVYYTEDGRVFLE